MKKSMLYLLSSLAVSALLLGYAGSAAATSFDDDSDSDSDRKSKNGGKVFLSDDDSDSDRKSDSRFTFLLGGYDDDSDSDSDRKLNISKVSQGGYDDDSDSDGRPGTYLEPGKDPVPAIPEPSAALIFAAGLGVAGLRRRS